MLTKLRALFRLSKAEPDAELMSGDALRELRVDIETGLRAQCEEAGSTSFLAPNLRIFLTVDGVQVTKVAVKNSLAHVVLRDLNVIRSYLVIRDDHLAIPQDILQDIARESARVLARQIRQLEVGATPNQVNSFEKFEEASEKDHDTSRK